MDEEVSTFLEIGTMEAWVH